MQPMVGAIHELPLLAMSLVFARENGDVSFRGKSRFPDLATHEEQRQREA